MKRFEILRAVAVAMLMSGVGALADTTKTDGAGSTAQSNEVVRPLQLALIPEVQLVPEDESIQGLRLNIYGSNRNVSGVDIGLVHETKGNFTGVAFGIMSLVRGEGRGLLFNGIYTEAAKSMSGLQVGMVNRSASMHGVQIGLANFADDMVGFQFGLWNEIKNRDNWNIIPLINANF